MKTIPMLSNSTLELGRLGVMAGRSAVVARPRHFAGQGAAMTDGVPTVVRSGDQSQR